MSFAKISTERRREIASLGGKSVPREKRSFSQNRDLAREAGRKGGTAQRRVTVKLTESETHQLARSVANTVDLSLEDGKVPRGA